MVTILMDVDGVLIHGRPQDGAHLFTDLESDLGIALDVLQREFFVPRWPFIVTGQKPLLPELAEVLADIAPAVSATALIDYWFSNDSRLDQHVLEAMADLRHAGNPVYLATNQEHMRAAYLMQVLKLNQYVDGIFYSAAIGHRKPSMEFYAHVEAGLGATPDHLLLIDDTTENVQAAQLRGWSAIHWQPGMTLPAALAAL